jgi:hypothetical protein
MKISCAGLLCFRLKDAGKVEKGLNHHLSGTDDERTGMSRVCPAHRYPRPPEDMHLIVSKARFYWTVLVGRVAASYREM